MNEIGIFAELATDFQNRYKVSRETASRLVGIFAAAAALHTDEKDAEAEFTRVVTKALADGEPWAAEYFTTAVETQYPQADTIAQAALAAGTDPVAALQAVYGIPAEAAAELATLLAKRTK